ncbi:porin [Vibrio sp. HA2012]|uniref:porin n=1 Tax=Vibrio sp. HA2012 TaxID=1971595 RepID=UPI000C2C0D8C|nr:porin [Vibrio sp. HA2012]PJC85505.1 porin [Vibrio sp. HA2012]
MEKIIKRTLTSAAVAAVTLSGSAQAAIQLAGDAVQFYGQAAIAYMYWDAEGAGEDNTASTAVESRFGLKGVVEFEDFGPDIVWQMETGNADGNGLVGGRDTFVGFAFDGVGSVTYGRQLVAAYNYVDWPHSNPGLGNVFDGHNAVKYGAKHVYQDRADHVLRFDSETFAGFNFQATLSGMEETTDAMIMNIAGSYTVGGISVHAGHYTQDEYGEGAAKVEDNSYTILGGSFTTGPMTFTAGYKMMEYGKDSQNAVSATAAYNHDDAWLYKVGYAHTFESDKVDDTESTAITARIMRTLPSAAIYFDIRNYDFLGDDEADDGTRFMLGTEYYF